MTILRYISIVLFMGLFTVLIAPAQELNCQISISTPGMSDRERQIMQDLRSELTEFVNQTNWTEYQLETQERIEASMQITIDEQEGSDEYRASIQVQSRRPVYETAYNSPVFSHRDRDLVFTYRENEPLEYAENSFLSNLTSVVAFYAYVVIGFDFDTYAPLGGTPFFEKAQEIVNQGQNAPQAGWKSYESQRNRYWLAENLLNNTHREIREAMYVYHRQGFDKMTDNMDLARGEVLNALEMLQQSHRERPGSLLMQVVLAAKSDELINLFAEAPAVERDKAIEILSEIDPSNSSEYRQMASDN
ncbi:MAG: DUF4835 family protein [Bacteroidales bacterium]